MKYIIDNRTKLVNVFKEANSLVEQGKMLNISVEKSSGLKTKKQLAFTFGLLVADIIRAYETCGLFKEGTRFNSKSKQQEYVKQMLYNMHSQRLEHVDPITNRVVSFGYTMSVMSKEEMSEFVTNVINMCDTYEIPLRPECRYLFMNSFTPEEIEEINGLKFPDKDPEFLAYTRKQHCIISGEYGCTAHHVRLNNVGLSGTVPDYMALPIKQEHHVRQDGHITTEEITEKCKSVLNGLDIVYFCRANYYNWKYKKY